MGCSNAILLGNLITRAVEIDLNGSYQVRFWGVSKEQSRQAEALDDVRKCEWTEENGISHADLEFVKPDKDIYERSYEIAGELHTDDRSSITFHEDLLSTYGIHSETDPSMTVYEIGLSMLTVIVIMFAVFLYNLFEFFLDKNRKYLGILEAIGATARQKESYVLLDALLVGSAGILAGICVGSILFICVWNYAANVIPFARTINKGLYCSMFIHTVEISVVCGYVMMLLACMVPLVKAGRVTALDILRRSDIPVMEYRGLWNLKKDKSIEYNFAMKDMYANQRRYLKITGMFIAFFAFVCFCGVWIGIQKGEYLIRDRRQKREPDQVITVNTGDVNKITTSFDALKKVNGLRHVQSVCALEIGGVVIDKKHIDPKKGFSVYGTYV